MLQFKESVLHNVTRNNTPWMVHLGQKSNFRDNVKDLHTAINSRNSNFTCRNHEQISTKFIQQVVKPHSLRKHTKARQKLDVICSIIFHCYGSHYLPYKSSRRNFFVKNCCFKRTPPHNLLQTASTVRQKVRVARPICFSPWQIDDLSIILLERTKTPVKVIVYVQV